MSTPVKFLLDQNFPLDPISTYRFNKNVTYDHLSSFAPDLSRRSTPDWMLYVAAAAGGFDGLVTGDKSQLEQDTELIALAQTGITLVTWRDGEADGITRWGQLLVYMPQILRRMDEASEGLVITIPHARLRPGAGGIDLASSIARARKHHDSVSYPERRDRELSIMLPALAERGFEDWSGLLMPRRAR